jgi:hypothetical protein
MKPSSKKHAKQHHLSAKMSSAIHELIHADSVAPEGCVVQCGYDENGEWKCVHICPDIGLAGEETNG